jgi:two-component sensor histidine kinase
MLRELDHRAKNILQSIAATLSLEASRAKSAEVKAAIGRVSERLKVMAEVQAMLYLWGNGGDGIAMDRYLAGLCEGISRGLRGPDGQLRFDIICEPFVWPDDTAQYIGMIVSEVLTNSCKHAFPQDHPGTVHLRLVSDGADKALLEMSDGGFGFDGDKAQDGLGMRLVSSFVQAMSGSLAITSQPHVGTTVEVRFPRPERHAGGDQTGPASDAGTSAASTSNPGSE